MVRLIHHLWNTVALPLIGPSQFLFLMMQCLLQFFNLSPKHSILVLWLNHLFAWFLFQTFVFLANLSVFVILVILWYWYMKCRCWLFAVRILQVVNVDVGVVKIISQGVSSLWVFIRFIVPILKYYDSSIVWTSVIIDVSALIGSTRVKLLASIAYGSVFRLKMLLGNDLWALVQFVIFWKGGCIIWIMWLISTFRMATLAIEGPTRLLLRINIVLKRRMQWVWQSILNQAWRSSLMIDMHCWW